LLESEKRNSCPIRSKGQKNCEYDGDDRHQKGFEQYAIRYGPGMRVGMSGVIMPPGECRPGWMSDRGLKAAGTGKVFALGVTPAAEYRGW